MDCAFCRTATGQTAFRVYENAKRDEKENPSGADAMDIFNEEVFYCQRHCPSEGLSDDTVEKLMGNKSDLWPRLGGGLSNLSIGYGCGDFEKAKEK